MTSTDKTQQQEASGWQFWVDRGGTFTDLVARTPDGQLLTHKLLSENPEAYEDAALQGIRDLLNIDKDVSLPADTIDAVKMGTTVATNALLERKGDATLLVVTKGFRDQLRIAYQARPRLFDKEIILPEMLYNRVEEVTERIDANNNIITPLDLDVLAPRLEAAFNDGIRSIAIVLMHGYRVPVHELAIAELARKIGFTQISTSHGTSPMIKFVGRGDTTVADAYLSPILRRYIDRLARDIDQSKGAKLQLMQSNGGLTDASLFQGKDAILSGPAGGIVGAVKTAKQAGFEKVITFDMGGTSTDVAHYENGYERVFDTVVAGVRINAPMLLIHTVAAGGGSICRFDQGRFQVGPESAGSNPGPACYRRGGPLAVTDCNVMLGKLQPQYFPNVFGPEQNQGLDVGPVRDGFAALAQTVEAETGVRRSEEEIANGFLRIAVENMANAIKKISVQRGYDVTEYALQCFGGAGGQHACLIADVLGMKTVLIHPFAGVLSAYGMGLADVTALRERSIETVFDAAIEARLCRELDDLASQSKAELVKQDIDTQRIETHRYVHLRYEGSDTALAVAFGSPSEMTRAFEAAYQSRFGFLMPDKGLVAAMISVESIGRNFDAESKVTATPNAPLETLDIVKCYMNDGFVDVPIFARDIIGVGQFIMGPALIVEPNGTNVIEPGWQAEMTKIGNLVVRRVEAIVPRVAVGTSCDPVMLEVFNNLFMSIAEQMGYTLQNTALSVNVKERLDFSCAIFDPSGALIANAPHMPVHLGSMGESVRAVIRSNPDNINAGDAFVLNTLTMAARIFPILP
jgi:5-oxoprolinase (ATP-hydrolysing)